MKYSTYTEYLALPEYRAVCRIVAERSQGLCEFCGDTADDFHHVKYCKWGEVDTPDNLLHVCRECHENEHTCHGCGGYLKAEAIKKRSKFCRQCRDNGLDLDTQEQSNGR
jgi:hypothetical protein